MPRRRRVRAGMFTANTMAAAAEALGMAPPGSASIPAVDARRQVVAFQAGERVMKLLREDTRPRDFLTRAAFLNAIATVEALGGSTNAVLHLMAIAYEAGVDLRLEDFDEISHRTPHLASLKPSGKYVMADLDVVGGVPVVMKELLDGGIIDGSTPNVAGGTLGDHLNRVREKPDQDLTFALDQPAQRDRHAGYPARQHRRGRRGRQGGRGSPQHLHRTGTGIRRRGNVLRGRARRRYSGRRRGRHS